MTTTEKTTDILAFGEPLMEFADVQRGTERLYLSGFGGDVSNVGVAAARQGASTGIFTALGDDPFGAGFLKLLGREGVDRSSGLVARGGGGGRLFLSPRRGG